MPITYTIDEAQGVIFETWTGEISSADLAEYWRRYLADPKVLALRRTLADIRGCNHQFTGEELDRLIHDLVIPVLKGRDWKTAIVAENGGQYGLSRQYQAFADSFSRDAIFSSPDEALAWLTR